MNLLQIQANSCYAYQPAFNENNHNNASVQDDFNFHRYPTCYFISEKYFHLEQYSGSVDF